MRRTSGSATETAARARLPGGPVEYTLRRSSRASRLRVVIHPDRGVVVTVPAGRGVRIGVDPSGIVERFLREREPWLRHHLARLTAEQARQAARGPFGDGVGVLFRGDPHRVRVCPARLTARRSTVSRDGGPDGDELVVELAPRDRRSLEAVLDGWCRERARAAIVREIERHGPGLGVRPAGFSIRDQRSRWGSASRTGRLSFSWRLVLAPPEALETVVIHELAHLRVFGHGPAFWALVEARKPDHRAWRRWLRTHSAELHAMFGA